MQIGTNFLGHFALTGLLLPQIGDRVVTLSSFAHRVGRISLDDLNWNSRRYRRWGAYGQSKLADLIFAYELDRRLDANGLTGALGTRPTRVTPSTELQSHTETVLDRVMGLGNRLLAQNAAAAPCRPSTRRRCPTCRTARTTGPDGLGEMRGHPKPVLVHARLARHRGGRRSCGSRPRS